MKTIKTLLAAAAVGTVGACAVAANPSFDAAFCDSTLRLDYIIQGVDGDVHIAKRHMHLKPTWAGRKTNLDSLLYCGNGQVAVMSMQGDTIYRNSFSTLFSEWLDLGDTVPATQELAVLVPYPRDSVMVAVDVLDKYHRSIASIKHIVDPADLLIRKPAGVKNNAGWKYLHQGAYDGPAKVRVAILGEGYTAEEMDVFDTDAQAVVDAMWTHEPYASMRDRFDFIAVYTPSAESGVSVPLEGKWRNTAFSSHFSTFYSDRYLTTGAVFDIYDALADVPADHLIILANTDVYGGGGIFNSYTLTTGHHADFLPVVVHEFGHSFGGLADEYFYEEEVMADTYPTDVEPWEPNITTLKEFETKWQELLPAGIPIPTDPKDAEKYPVGVYEGGGYSFHGIYRPADDCRMRTNRAPGFCPACQAALERIIRYYTE